MRTVMAPRLPESRPLSHTCIPVVSITMSLPQRVNCCTISFVCSQLATSYVLPLPMSLTIVLPVTIFHVLATYHSLPIPSCMFILVPIMCCY
jgi:hypothetical protein